LAAGWAGEGRRDGAGSGGAFWWHFGIVVELVDGEVVNGWIPWTK